MTKLSVNINKIALIRNAREGNLPDLIKFAMDCESYGADGITVHPRPDQRHIRYSDIPLLKGVVKTELNIEGYPSEPFLQLVEQNVPDQCTLVPDPPGVLTSSEGWDTITHRSFLFEVVQRLQMKGIRVSLFIDPLENQVLGAKETQADRVEFYTGKYAELYALDKEEAIKPHMRCAKVANEIGIDINAGHDLNLENLNYYGSSFYGLKEVSIGHALISDALYYGVQNTIRMYKQLLN